MDKTTQTDIFADQPQESQEQAVPECEKVIRLNDDIPQDMYAVIGEYI